MIEIRDQKSEIGKSGRTSMTNKIIFLALCSLLLAPCCAVDAQQPTKVPRIGYLAGTSASGIASRIEAFRQGLRELGYVEGKNIVIEYRYAEGKADRERELAVELVRLKVDIIVSAGSAATRPSKEATSTIPIVMTNEGDPVGTGFVANLAWPGGNITGLSNLAPELSGKRLELLKEIIPKLSLVAVFRTSTQGAVVSAHQIAIAELAVAGQRTILKRWRSPQMRSE
jgi:ABC-type uncharacterized transport system substrate-binding protein